MTARDLAKRQAAAPPLADFGPRKGQIRNAPPRRRAKRANKSKRLQPACIQDASPRQIEDSDQ